MRFGEKLTKLRKEKDMSQEDLANSLNFSRQAVIELYGSEYNFSPIYTFTDDVYCRENYGYVDNAVLSKTYTYYNYYDYFNGNTINDFLKNSLKLIKEKKIITDDLLFNVETKIHISKENYEKLKQNLNSCVYRSYDVYDYE